MAANVPLGALSVDNILRHLPGLRLPQPRPIPLHRLREFDRARGRPFVVRMVRTDFGYLGRNAAAVAGPASACGLLFRAASSPGLGLRNVFLLRELALYRLLYGRCPRHGSSFGYHRRLRLRRARLAYHLLEPGCSAVRQADCKHRQLPWLVRNDCGVCVAGAAGLAGKRVGQVGSECSATRLLKETTTPVVNRSKA